MSDLHADWYENYLWCRQNLAPCADVLLIAGDTFPYLYKKRQQFVRNVLLSRWKTVVDIPGNHDYYGKKADWEIFDGIHEVIQVDDNAYHYINNNFIDLTINGQIIRVICSTLWSKVVNRPIDVMRGLNDYKEIKGYTIDINNSKHEACVRFIDKILTETPAEIPCVVLTHHQPLLTFIDDTFIGNPINEAYATDLYPLINKHADKIKAWVMGHSHAYRKDILGGIQFIRNPLGYPPSVGSKYFLEPRSFKMDTVIEI
jgi:DNA repair exonuclease SbcCD nuclease subunit